MSAGIMAAGDATGDKLREFYELSVLYDFYGELLGEHKRKIFEGYVQNDLSLAEIADEAGISRQGVHDIIRRCTKSLREYENKLKLVEKFRRAQDYVAEIRRISDGILESGDVGRVKEIAKISEQILKEF